MTDDSRMVIHKRRSKGGYLKHYILDGQYRALCGYRPSSPRTTKMKHRHGWSTADASSNRPCAKCQRAWTRLQLTEMRSASISIDP